MNKKGSMVLRDIIMLIIVFTGIIALASIFVNDMGDTYSNTNMTSSYNQDSLGETQLQNTTSAWEEIGQRMNGNLGDMFIGTLQAAGEILTEVIKAPATFSSMVTSILTDIGVEKETTQIFHYILTAILYIIIIFVIISAFLQGGKL